MSRNIVYTLTLMGCLAIGNKAFAQQDKCCLPGPVDKKVEALLSRMTLAEKIGQLNQYNGDWEATGPVTSEVGNKMEEIRQGRVGAVLNIMGTGHVRAFQEAAMQSRLKIPLLFGQDVIHGYRITFPIPLAEASSWDMDAIGLSERIAATEASASGINWTFAPMVDITRDPRWGRVMEGAGEDPYLGSSIAAARVRGFQGKGLGSTDAIMACAKHFAAYGAAIGGRDYNSVDMSLRSLWEIYLPPFKAALDAGVATFMNSFNDLNGTPATGSRYLQRDILKGQWGFKGFVVSDWGSIGEMINHGYVKNKEEAAEVAIKAGSDMDMESRSYINNLARLVAEKKVPVSLIDDAVRRILKKKFELGLFDDPYRFINPQREKTQLNRPENLEAARDMARKSMVLLKNEHQLLPLSADLKSIALIGPLVKAKKELKGFWSLEIDKDEDIPSLMDGMQQQAGSTRLLYAPGCGIDDTVRSGFAEAVAAASQADVVVMAMGEAPDMTGEAKSKSNIHLPGVQEDLIRAIQATGKPVVVLLMAGRPMVFNWTADHVPAILYAWWTGSQGGNAMADVLYGKYNPSGKLPITFPRSEGQIPIYYDHYNTGRPAKDDKDRFYRSAYIDLPLAPQYAFGYGLSYTSFDYSDLAFSRNTMRDQETINVSFVLKNTGKYAGEEVAQLYLRAMVSKPLRPVKELKDFRKLLLQPGESRPVSFTIKRAELAFYNDQLKRVTEPGEFQVMIGSASDDIRLQMKFNLLN
jgi:beta-glucosidase